MSKNTKQPSSDPYVAPDIMGGLLGIAGTIVDASDEPEHGEGHFADAEFSQDEMDEIVGGAEQGNEAAIFNQQSFEEGKEIALATPVLVQKAGESLDRIRDGLSVYRQQNLAQGEEVRKAAAAKKAAKLPAPSQAKGRVRED